MKRAVILFFVLHNILSVAQDTVRYLDPCYLFYPYHENNALVDLNGSDTTHASSFSNYTVFMHQAQNENITIYGIALAVNGLPYVVDNHLAPSFYLYLDNSKESQPVFTIADSIRWDMSQINRRYLYQYGNAGEHTQVVPVVEFYFDTPHEVAAHDSFYTSWHWRTGIFQQYIESISIAEGDTALPFDHWFCLYHGITRRPINIVHLTYDIDTLFNVYPSDIILARIWGGMFPIVGLRCVAPWLQLVERGNGTATVSWTQAEAGVGYELSFGPYGINPDSGTIVGTTDTVYTLTGLESGVREAVWVRKACRYDIYDSTVWSDWSLPLVFLTLGVDEVEGEAVRLQVRDGAVAVVGAADGEEVKLYDALGRQVATARAAAGTETLLAAPAAGVYTVRIGSHPARRVVLTR